MKNLVIRNYDKFNPRRYKNPWVSLVDEYGRVDFSKKIGKYTGAYNKGEAGQLYIFKPKDKQIYAYGQPDIRGNNSTINYIQFLGGNLIPIDKDKLIDVINEDIEYSDYVPNRKIITEITGDYAIFTRPELKTERVSYPVITPSAVRGILSSIFWKPQMKHVIDKIHVINEPEYINIYRNEIKTKISHNKVKKMINSGIDNSSYIYAQKVRERRNSRILKNVKYIVESHIEVLSGESENKYYSMITRRLKKGQFFRCPFLGCKEFAANVKLIESEEYIPKSNLNGEINLGFMLYDLDFIQDTKSKDYKINNIKPMFFEAILKNGILDLENVNLFS